MTEPKFDADKQLVAELIAALAAMLDYFGDARREDWIGDEEFVMARTIVTRARAVLEKVKP